MKFGAHIALRMSGGKVLCAEGGGPDEDNQPIELTAREGVGPWESFTVEEGHVVIGLLLILVLLTPGVVRGAHGVCLASAKHPHRDRRAVPGGGGGVHCAVGRAVLMPMAPAPACLVSSCPERRPCPTHDAGAALRPAWWGWYHLARWRHPVWGVRAQALRRNPLCHVCQREGLVTVATEVDHITPHRGDPVLFWALSNVAGLCHPHHAEKTARGE